MPIFKFPLEIILTLSGVHVIKATQYTGLKATPKYTGKKATKSYRNMGYNEYTGLKDAVCYFYKCNVQDSLLGLASCN